jgi:methionyl-tRNA formyltransferase
MTLRVAVLTSGPVGNTGNVLARIADVPGVEIVCLIVSDESGFRGSRMRRLKKIARIGPLGAANGYRIRPWFNRSGSVGEDAREVAARRGIPQVDVVKVNHARTKQALVDHRVDLGISLGNGYIASWIFSVPTYGFVNFHGEILPDYPGGQSVIWPIYFGRTETGFTIHSVAKGIDTGEIVFQERRPIRFGATLRETVEGTLAEATDRVPAAFADLLEHWDRYWGERRPNAATRHFTTPTLWQFLRIARNNRRLFGEARAGQSAI